jgi:putative transposase
MVSYFRSMRYEDYAEVPDHFYRNHLPHFDPGDAPYFVTYRLHGSVPKSEIQRLKQLYQQVTTDETHREFFRQFDNVLDANGPYRLREEHVREIVSQSLHDIDTKDIHLYAYTIMPNHVHAVFDLRTARKLYEVMKSHKGYTARLANKHLGLTGSPFWHPETYDRVVRAGRLSSTIWYTILNPVKAGFVKQWRDWPGTYLAPDCIGFD